MKVARFRYETPDGPEIRIAVASAIAPDSWIDVRRFARLQLKRRGATASAARRLATLLVPESLSQAFEYGDTFLDILREASQDTSGDTLLAPGGQLVAPLDPTLYRDFVSFEQHFVNMARVTGQPVAPVLYDLPVHYIGNHHTVVGPDAEVPWPPYAHAGMDYELELGLVIGKAGRDLHPEHALHYVFGLTILNDFTARDIQAREMESRLGPPKAKSFCTAIGPVIVTLDELPTLDLRMVARVNGAIWSEGQSGTMLWSIPELVAWASTSELLPAGALLGTGTVGFGSGAELGRELHPGDTVELEVEGIGILRNRIGHPTGRGWLPASKQRRDSENVT
ncbi:MAG: fumarylacetoacetate hydrolase family protein [Thermomicrobium sp.]|nr:fumarylacetoacetate hydrolase family protein [Thermomicrobium sp.]